MKTKPNLKKLDAHPLGAIFPAMSDPDYDTLVTGIKAVGYDKKHPIVLFEGGILDGNNRYTAAKKAGIPLTEDMFVEYNGDDPIGFVIKENLARRNLTPSQASMLASELVEKMEEAEKAAANLQGSNGTENPKTKKVKGAKVAAAAEKLGVSSRSVATARKVKKKNPKAAEAVKSGKTSLHAAEKETDSQQSKEEAKTKLFEEASARIDSICGPGFTLIAAKKLLSKHILQLSHLEEEEMKRIKPLIEAGWPLKAAIGYKSVTLTLAHPIRALIERADAQGGNFLFMTDTYEITVARKSSAQPQADQPPAAQTPDEQPPAEQPAADQESGNKEPVKRKKSKDSERGA